MNKKILSIAAVVWVLGVAPGQAHTPLMVCMDNSDGSITCEGGFSDGSSAAGVAMEVRDLTGKVLVQGKMDKLATFTFKKPSRPFKVIFDAGPGHVLEIQSREISK